VRNTYNPQNKSWFDVKFDQLNASTINVNSGQTISTVAGSKIFLQGSEGSAGQVLKKDVSNQPSWEPDTEVFGDEAQFQTTREVTPFTTSSAINVPVDTFTTTAVPAGNYILHYTASIKNVGGPAYMMVEDTTGAATLSEFVINGTIDEYQACTGFVQIALTTTNVFTLFTKVITPATTNSINSVRFQLYRVS